MEDLQVSSSDAAAPTPDTAAAPAGGVATDASQSATAAGTETAASTETGAKSTSDTLNDLFTQFQSKSQEADAPEAVQPKPEEEKPVEEPKPEEEQETEEPVEATEVDPLAEEARIPTRAEIEEKYKRAPKAIRDEFADTAEKLAPLVEEREALGGDEGMAVAKAIVPKLFEAASDENGIALFEAMVDANPTLVSRMGGLLINSALNDERTGAAFGDQLLVSEFGEGYTAERIRELVEFDRQGLIDREELGKDTDFGRQPTARERDLEAKLRERDAEVKQLRGEGQDATAKEEQRLQETVENSIFDAVKKVVDPLAEKLGWRGEQFSVLGELADVHLRHSLKGTPEWAQIQQLAAEGNAFRGGKPTTAMRVKLEAITRRGDAHFRQTARRLNAFTKGAAGKKPADPPPPPPTPDASRSGDENTPDPRREDARENRHGFAETTQQRLDRLAAQFEARTRDAQTPVGTSRR